MTAAASADIFRLYPGDRVRTAVSGPSALSDEHFAAFVRDGFVAVDGIFSGAEIECAKGALSSLIGGENPKYKVDFESGVDVSRLSADQREPYVRKLMSFVQCEPRLMVMSQNPGMMSVVKRLVGSEVMLIQDMALLKPARVGREKPWHQDTAYFTYHPPQLVLGVWIALDEATAENGCMHVIPGSHLGGPKPHYHDRDCQLPDDVVDVGKSAAVPLRPGGALFFSGLLHHGTPPNNSPLRRRAVQFHYASVNCRKAETAEHAAYFHDAKGYSGCAGWGDPHNARPISDRADCKDGSRKP